MNTRELLGSCMLKEVALVTDAHHMPRALQYAMAVWPLDMSIVPVLAQYRPTTRERAHEVIAKRITTHRLRQIRG